MGIGEDERRVDVFLKQDRSASSTTLESISQHGAWESDEAMPMYESKIEIDFWIYLLL